MKGRFNNTWLGVILGLVVPVITIFVAWKIRFDHLDVSEFFSTMMARKMMSAIISLCAIPNLLVFLIFIWLNNLLSARGVLLSTFIAGFIMIIIKFLL
ncbi:MAG: hypothetical protein ISS19_00710 [Bacteroidales bacterium]|nr:hypothetical protein [Bacteroidales bacterium]